MRHKGVAVPLLQGSEAAMFPLSYECEDLRTACGLLIMSHGGDAYRLQMAPLKGVGLQQEASAEAATVSDFVVYYIIVQVCCVIGLDVSLDDRAERAWLYGHLSATYHIIHPTTL